MFDFTRDSLLPFRADRQGSREGMGWSNVSGGRRLGLFADTVFAGVPLMWLAGGAGAAPAVAAFGSGVWRWAWLGMLAAFLGISKLSKFR
ncbi:hypothetical protein GUJ93_ZPchr0002g24474 [Zizania palustris]|uniref:Uncharacterized protein n=1 Tax=Zizania palustris TaxID=103762 RepID=A0A8J5RS28_ZIZPA|nr:hypothetical protein GUJ93_ZPchr0002g24474 [Zizania palustris]